MRKKQRFKEMLSSIFGVDIHPNNSAVLDSKKDIEQNVQKILAIVGEENNMDDSVNSFDKSELTSLVTDFYKSYQNLYEHYYQLIEKLHRGDKGDLSNSSSSGSSDSDSDSENKKRSRKVNEEITQVISLQDYQDLQEQLEHAERKNLQLQSEVGSTSSKLAELENLAAKLKERESVIVTLEYKLLTMEGSFEVLQSENEVLKQKVEALLMEETDTKEMIGTVTKENEALKSENKATSDKLSRAEKSIQELLVLKDQMCDEMLRLKFESMNLKKEVEGGDEVVVSMKHKLNDTIKEKEDLKLATEESSSKIALLLSEVERMELMLKAAETKGDDLIQRFTTVEEENRNLQSEILILSRKIKEAESTINYLTAESELLKDEKSKLLNSSNDLNEQVKAKEDEVHFLASQLEKAQMAEDEVETLSAEMQTMKNEHSRLLANYEDLNLTLESRDAEASNLKQIIEAAEGENKFLTEENLLLASKVQQVELERDGLKDENEQLMEDASLLRSKSSNLDVELKALNYQMNDLNKELGVMAEEKDRLLSEFSRLMSELEQADINVNELAKELEQSKDENSALQLNKIKQQETEKMINGCKAEIEQLRNDKVLLQTNLDDTRLELEVTNCRMNDLNKEVVVLREGNNTSATELQMALVHEQKLENELEQLREEISVLQQTNAGLHNKNSDTERRLKKIIDDCKAEIVQIRNDNALLQTKLDDARLELGVSNCQMTDLNKEVAVLREGNNTAAAELQQALIHKQKLDSELEQLREEISLLQQTNAGLHNKNFDMERRSEKMIDDCKAEIEQLRNDNAMLQTKLDCAILELEVANCRMNDLSKDVVVLREGSNTSATELQLALVHEQKLENELEQLREDISMLQQTNAGLHNKNSDMEKRLKKIIDDCKAEIEQLRNENALLQTKLDDAKLELEVSNCQMTDLNKEVAVLREGSNKAATELQQALIHEQKLDSELEQLREEISLLQQTNVGLHNKNFDMERRLGKMIDDCKAEIEQLRNDNAMLQTKLDGAILELEVADCQMTDLNKEVAILREGNNTAATELQLALIHEQKLESDLDQLREEISLLQQSNAGLQNTNSEMERRLGEMGGEVLTLQEKIEEVQRESDCQIQVMTIRADDLQKELDLLSIQKSKVEKEVIVISDRCSENLFLMKILEEELQSKIVYQETRLADLRGSFNEFLSNFKQFKHKFEILENLSIDQNKDMMKLENSCKELEEKLVLSEDEKVNAQKEIVKMHGQIQTLEVQVRLSNQKVKITETESRDKEENYKKLVEMSQTRAQELEEQMQKLYGKLGSLQSQLMQMKEDARLGTAALGNRIHELESIFSHKSSRFIGRVVECTEKLKILEEMVENQLYEKEELKNEKHEMAVRLEEKEGIISSLTDEARYVGANLAKKERDSENLMRTVIELEKKMGELEKRVNEKEEEMVAKNEEKREAIRQLCLLIEYHRENCSDLLRHLSPTIRSRSS